MLEGGTNMAVRKGTLQNELNHHITANRPSQEKRTKLEFYFHLNN